MAGFYFMSFVLITQLIDLTKINRQRVGGVGGRSGRWSEIDDTHAWEGQYEGELE